MGTYGYIWVHSLQLFITLSNQGCHLPLTFGQAVVLVERHGRYHWAEDLFLKIS